MKDSEVIMFFVALVVLLRRKVEWGEGWAWPVPSARIAGRVYKAVITQESHDGHNGVDIMYQRRDANDLAREYPPGTKNGNPKFFAPPSTPVLAARAGVIWSAARTPRGWAVVISHGKPFATFYQHLETLAVETHANGVNIRTGNATSVMPGTVIGYMGGDPLDHNGMPQPEARQLRHLHFEVWHEGAANHAIAPDDEMPKWSRVPFAFTPTP